VTAPTAEQAALIGWAVGAVELAHPHARARSGGQLDGWRFAGTAALILALGRLFDAPAAPLPPAERGDPDTWWANAAEYAAARPGLAYVEGWAAPPNGARLGMHQPHAWCAVDLAAVEPTRGWNPGTTTYLGVPMTPDYVRHLHDEFGPGPLLWDSPAAAELCRTGVPDDALVDVGRPLPDLTAWAMRHAEPPE
jgi:hypothetical protein